MFFIPCSVDRQWNPLALAPKKSIALQLRRQPSVGIVPISGISGASVTTSPDGQTPPTVAPVPSAGWADVGVQGAPLEVMEQLVMAAIPLPMAGWTGLPTALMALTVVGAT